MQKSNIILKLHYVINHIIFDFFHNFSFLKIKQIVKIDVKVKGVKYLGRREYILFH
jgi:hypothetical protein